MVLDDPAVEAILRALEDGRGLVGLSAKVGMVVVVTEEEPL